MAMNQVRGTWYVLLFQPVSELHALTLAAPPPPILFIRFPSVTLCEITKPNGRGDMTVLSVDYSCISHLATGPHFSAMSCEVSADVGSLVLP